MKERILNVVKVLLIICGVMFLIQVLLIIGAILGLTCFANMDLKPNKYTQAKELKPVITYVNKYKEENKQYPENINDLKLNKNFDYKYELSKDKNCYTIEAKSKKDKTEKNYQECLVTNDNATSFSQVYFYKN